MNNLLLIVLMMVLCPLVVYADDGEDYRQRVVDRWYQYAEDAEASKIYPGVEQTLKVECTDDGIAYVLLNGIRLRLQTRDHYVSCVESDGETTRKSK